MMLTALDLPPELWVVIFSYLQPQDLVCLLATCRLLRQYSLALAPPEHIRSVDWSNPSAVVRHFLMGAELDRGINPTKRFCHYCGHWDALTMQRRPWYDLSWDSILPSKEQVCCLDQRSGTLQHEKLFERHICPRFVKTYYTLGKPRPVHLFCSPWRGRHWVGRYKVLHWEIVQMVMRAQRFGPRFGIALACLERHIESLDDQMERTIKAKAMVVNGYLLLKLSCIWTGSVVADCSPHCTHFCGQGTNLTPLSRLLQCLAGHLTRGVDPETCEACRATYRCNHCPSEYRVEVVRAKGSDRLCLNRWINFGKGLTPWDKEWPELTKDEPWELPGQLQIKAAAETTICKLFEMEATSATSPMVAVVAMN